MGELDVTPVRISRGVPKFWSEAGSFPEIELLEPDGWMFGVKDPEKFGRCYRRKLHQASLEVVIRELEAIPTDKPLALVCFEHDPSQCHRDQFACWWFRKTGELIPEFGVDTY